MWRLVRSLACLLLACLCLVWLFPMRPILFETYPRWRTATCQCDFFPPPTNRFSPPKPFSLQNNAIHSRWKYTRLHFVINKRSINRFFFNNNILILVRATTAHAIIKPLNKNNRTRKEIIHNLALAFSQANPEARHEDSTEEHTNKYQSTRQKSTSWNIEVFGR